jgi:PPOX class probable F420-dependent enzyme
MSITDEKYVSLTTFRKDGTPKPAPVWIADFGDGAIGCTTASSSYKIKRISNDPGVTLQPCNSRGVVTEGSEVVSGTAEVVTGAEFERCAGMVKKKYKLQYTLMALVGKGAKLIGKGSGTDAAIKITVA